MKEGIPEGLGDVMAMQRRGFVMDSTVGNPAPCRLTPGRGEFGRRAELPRSVPLLTWTRDSPDYSRLIEGSRERGAFRFSR